MWSRGSATALRRLRPGRQPICARPVSSQIATFSCPHAPALTVGRPPKERHLFRHLFHSSTRFCAAPPSADVLMESINDLYATAKDEFEMAAEETEKKTIYAADDREAAHDAFRMLKEGFDKAVSQSDPEVAKEVQTRVGSRIRELENAIKAMDQMAMED